VSAVGSGFAVLLFAEDFTLALERAFVDDDGTAAFAG